MFRIVLARDPDTSEPRTSWFFSALPTERPGRFDLPRPHGSCYFCDRRYGAWLEVFRQTGLVDRADVDRRRLVIARRTRTALHVADFRAARARPFGVTDELIAGSDYTRPQRWAAALHRVDHAGIASTARHDPTATARTTTLFGRAGPRRRVTGWHTEIHLLTDGVALSQELSAFGTGIAPRPYDVPIAEPKTVR